MTTDSLTYKALELCLTHGIPFAMYRHPGKKRIAFYAAPSLLSKQGIECAADKLKNSGGFFISRFAEDLDKAMFIPCELTAERLLKANVDFDAGLQPCDFNEFSTLHEEYIARIAKTVSLLRRRQNAKTVMSAVCLLPRPADMCAAISNLFKNSPNDFCNCYYHPDAGFWAGATPELLLSFNYSSLSFQTMALAGTLPKDAEWDDKNLKENEIVCEYIESQLSKAGVRAFTRRRLAEKEYGSIKHLIVNFRGSTFRPDPLPLIAALNPTPALNGYPKDTALSDIARLEPHRRLCYGGLVGYKKGDCLHAFVNIRCMQFNQSHLCLFSGGGIMPDSDPETEWREAAAKRQVLITRLNIETNVI